MGLFSLSDSTKVRKELTDAQYKQIQSLYQQLAARAQKRAKLLEGSTASANLQREELRKLAKELQQEAQKIASFLEGSIKDDMTKVSEAVVKDALKFNSLIGLDIKGAFSHVPADIVETILTGKLYQGNWSLSGALWIDIAKTQQDINKIIAEGIALNKSAYDIAKDLEKYVDPSARKDWDWSKVYPGTKKKVDYVAQRLARTMVGHAYQQSVVATAKNNPFSEGILWISGHSHRTCEICRDRDGNVYPADKLPLDHPNGMCSFAVYISKSLTDIADELADWVEGKPNKAMDDWVASMTK